MALPKRGRALLFVPALLLLATLGWPACLLQAQEDWARRDKWQRPAEVLEDRKSTRLNSSHGYISYAVFCLKKKKKRQHHSEPRYNVPRTLPPYITYHYPHCRTDTHY